MTHPALLERITRSLAYMLRHQPEKFDLKLDPYGWGELSDVVQALNEKLGEPVGEEDVEDAIRSGDRPRYEVQSGRVRALYGHSIDVLPGDPSKPPEFLYVGVASRDADRALRYGLRGGRRRFLHLARSVDEAREAGRRTGPKYSVLTVFALDAWEEGVDFYDRQALFLAEEIPTQFIEVHESGEDGYEVPVQQGRSGRSRGGRGGREGRGGERGREEHGRRRRGGRHARGEEESREVRRDRPREERRDRPREERRDRPRDDRPRGRTERRREADREQPAEQPAVVVARPSREESTDFGLGVFEDKPASARPAPVPPPEPEPVRKPEPEPEPEPQPEPREEGPAFGAGI